LELLTSVGSTGAHHQRDYQQVRCLLSSSNIPPHNDRFVSAQGPTLPSADATTARGGLIVHSDRFHNFTLPSVGGVS